MSPKISPSWSQPSLVPPVTEKFEGCARLAPLAGGDSLDWKDLSASEITSRVLERVKPGSIVLFHNAALHTPEALPAIIEKLQADGYALMRASELIHDGEYTLDHEGRQIPKS